MEDYLLFRKRSPLTEEGLEFICGCEEHSLCARRNTSGRAAASAILLRALRACLEGNVVEAWTGNVGTSRHIEAQVRSTSTPGSINPCAVVDQTSYRFVHGSPEKVTYHIGVLAMLQALASPTEAQDLIHSYHELVVEFVRSGLTPSLKAHLLKCADELYFWLRYGPEEPLPTHDRMPEISLGDIQDRELVKFRTNLDIGPLTQPDSLKFYLSDPPADRPASTKRSSTRHTSTDRTSGFVGGQLDLLLDALNCRENVLLAGYTGTGKTLCMQQAALLRQVNLVVVEGKEGMVDLDFLGAFLPRPDGTRLWVDGPLLRALRLAETEPVILFLDEINRFPRHQLNLLIGLMNRKSGQVCRLMGMEIASSGEYYVLEVPLTSEVVACPSAHLGFVVAGNFGRTYAVYDLDPALRRRLSTVIDFEFLPFKLEKALVERQYPRLKDGVSNALVKVAAETRRMMENGELPGCIDTASLLNWAGKCEHREAQKIDAVMECARLTWADQVCGRNHMGQVNTGTLKALEDYLQALDLLKDDRSPKESGNNGQTES
jgi:MoxR-like ATPase